MKVQVAPVYNEHHGAFIYLLGQAAIVRFFLQNWDHCYKEIA